MEFRLAGRQLSLSLDREADLERAQDFNELPITLALLGDDCGWRLQECAERGAATRYPTQVAMIFAIWFSSTTQSVIHYDANGLEFIRPSQSDQNSNTGNPVEPADLRPCACRINLCVRSIEVV